LKLAKGSYFHITLLGQLAFVITRKQYRVFLRALEYLCKVVPVLLTEHHAMKVYWGSGDIGPAFFDLGTRWK